MLVLENISHRGEGPQLAAPGYRLASAYLLAIGILMLVGCGFALRGNIDIPPDWLALHLSSVSPNGELSREVESAFSNNGVQWLESDAANYTLHLGPEQMRRRNLSIGANARAAEFELTLSTSLRVTSSDGTELLPTEELVVQKIMTHDPENVGGKVEEERLLQREMRIELVQNMLRRIRFLATNPATIPPTTLPTAPPPTAPVATPAAQQAT